MQNKLHFHSHICKDSATIKDSRWNKAEPLELYPVAGKLCEQRRILVLLFPWKQRAFWLLLRFQCGITLRIVSSLNHCFQQIIYCQLTRKGPSERVQMTLNIFTDDAWAWIRTFRIKDVRFGFFRCFCREIWQSKLKTQGYFSKINWIVKDLQNIHINIWLSLNFRSLFFLIIVDVKIRYLFRQF